MPKKMIKEEIKRGLIVTFIGILLVIVGICFLTPKETFEGKKYSLEKIIELLNNTSKIHVCENTEDENITKFCGNGIHLKSITDKEHIEEIINIIIDSNIEENIVVNYIPDYNILFVDENEEYIATLGCSNRSNLLRLSKEDSYYYIETEQNNSLILKIMNEKKGYKNE